MVGGFQFSTLFLALSERNFRFFAIGNAASLVGTWMHRIGVGWLTWQLTESAGWLGIIAFADLFPAAVVAPFAGVAADRLNQLRMMKLAQAFGTGFVSILTLLYFADALDIWTLFWLTLLLGVVDAWASPVRLVFVSMLVPKARLNAAVAIKSVTYNSARFIGPALGGIIIANGSVGWVFVCNAISFVLFYWLLSLIRTPERPGNAVEKSAGVILDALSGVRYVFKTPGIRLVLALLFVACMCGRPLLELLPAWAAEFSGGAGVLAALTSASGVGAVIGGLWLAGRASPLGLTRTYLCCVVGLGASLLIFAMLASMAFALPIVAVAGLFMVTSSVSAQTLVQINIEDAFRGRVMSVYVLIMRGAPALGAFIMGWTSEWLGMRVPLVSGALLVLTAVTLPFFVLRSLEGVLESRFR